MEWTSTGNSTLRNFRFSCHSTCNDGRHFRQFLNRVEKLLLHLSITKHRPNNVNQLSEQSYLCYIHVIQCMHIQWLSTNSDHLFSRLFVLVCQFVFTEPSMSRRSRIFLGLTSSSQKMSFIQRILMKYEHFFLFRKHDLFIMLTSVPSPLPHSAFT